MRADAQQVLKTTILRAQDGRVMNCVANSGRVNCARDGCGCICVENPLRRKDTAGNRTEVKVNHGVEFEPERGVRESAIHGTHCHECPSRIL